MNTKQKSFLKDLSKLLKKHNVNFDLECERIGYEGAQANLMFDCENEYYSFEIWSTGGSVDITYKDIDKLIESKEN